MLEVLKVEKVERDRKLLGEYLGGLKAGEYRSPRGWALWRQANPTERADGPLSERECRHLTSGEEWHREIREALDASPYVKRGKDLLEQAYSAVGEVIKLQKTTIKRCKEILTSKSAIHPQNLYKTQQALESAQRILNLYTAKPTSIVGGQPTVQVLIYHEHGPHEKPGEWIQGKDGTITVAAVRVAPDREVHRSGSGQEIRKDGVDDEAGNDQSSPITGSRGDSVVHVQDVPPSQGEHVGSRIENPDRSGSAGR